MAALSACRNHKASMGCHTQIENRIRSVDLAYGKDRACRLQLLDAEPLD